MVSWAGMIVYILVAIIVDQPVHKAIYPIVGNGYPLTGRRRWALRIVAPIVGALCTVVVGIAFVLVVTAVIGVKKP